MSPDPDRTEPPPPPQTSPRFAFTRKQYLGLPLLIAIPVLTLFGVFGERRDVARASSRSVEMTVRYPSRFRYRQVQSLDVAVRNVSAGGVYLEGTPAEYPQLKPGTEIDLVIFGSEDGSGEDPEFNITCRAKVIRVDAGFAGKRPPGFGVTIDPVDQDNRERLTNLLLRASGYRAGGSGG